MTQVTDIIALLHRIVALLELIDRRLSEIEERFEPNEIDIILAKRKRDRSTRTS